MGSPALLRLRNHPRHALLSLGLLALAVALVLGAATGRASSGNCFAGALSQDPIHCQVLSDAYDEGVLDIKAMYEGASVLYIFIANPESEWQAIEDYIFQEAKQAVQADPVPYCYEEPHPDWCNGGTLGDWFASNAPGRGGLLPGSQQYANLRIVPGGEQALTEQDAWPSFKRLWPRSDALFAGIGGFFGGDGTFDLSDVDLVVSGEPDCSGYGNSGCWIYQRFPELEITSRASTGPYPSSTIFYQLKAEPGRERERIEAVKAALLRLRPDLEPGVNSPKLHFTPVKYSYFELWRWVTLLERFIQSQSNDIGVNRVYVGINTSVAFRESHYLPAAGLTEITDTDKMENRVRVRSTIVVWSFDPQKTIRALPQLLSQLGIPEDAVGKVVDGNELPQGAVIPE